jgi:hypothetical protein
LNAKRFALGRIICRSLQNNNKHLLIVDRITFYISFLSKANKSKNKNIPDCELISGNSQKIEAQHVFGRYGISQLFEFNQKKIGSLFTSFSL